MISRLTAIATVFAVLATATLALAASPARQAAPAANAVQLERVVITGHYTPAGQN